MRTLRILTVDDHEMITTGYKYLLEAAEFEEFQIKVETANSFETGKQKIEDSARSFKYDLLLLDVQLTETHLEEPQTGEDLGIIARKIIPDTKIVFMSSFSDNYRINSILKNVNPDGYMVKSEIDEKSLIAMVRGVINSPPYYSQKALAAIRKKVSNDLLLDDNDKKILYHVSIGTRTKDMVDFINLSLAGIENRKRQLKVIFGVEKQNDLALVHEARNRGFL